MKAISLRCPECGAALRADPSAASVTCDYCHTTSAVQKRTGVFQRPMPPPSLPAGQPHMPVAVARPRFTIIYVIAGLGMLAGVIAPIMATRGGCEPAAVRALKEPRWDGVQGAALVDVDGDGVDDIVGRLRILQPESVSLVGAFSGVDGKRLWRSEVIGERSTVHQAPLGVADGTVLMADGSAGLRAFKLADGSSLWSIRLNEKIDRLCRGGGDGVVLARTADDKGHPVTVADGSIGAAVSLDRKACDQLPGDDMRNGTGADVVLYNWHNTGKDLIPRDAIEGMHASEALHHRAAGITLAIGYKKPGSRIGMVARYDAAPGATPVVAWKTQVPGVDPLSVDEGEPEPEHVALTPDYVVVAYQTKKSSEYRLTALKTDSGVRAWDILLPGDRPLGAVLASKSHALVSRWDGLYVFALPTGKPAFTIE